jgi:hypothetical protein
MCRYNLSLIASVLVLQLMSASGCSQEQGPVAVRLMIYNAENLFDIKDDSLSQDNEFLPRGQKKWTYQRYVRKINSLYKTIVAAGSDYPPGIVALCEVENRKVLEDLVYGTYLNRYKYRIIHEDSPDPRGIDVCLIYRTEILKLIDYSYWVPSGMGSEKFISRSVLCARFSFNEDTLHLIVNHWPSRRGGVLAGEELRRKIAAMLRGKVDSISKKCGSECKIIIAGDFNCTPEDHEIRTLIKSVDPGFSLTDLAERLSEAGLGTYRYMGTWEMIDQVIVSGSILSAEKGLFTRHSMLRIFDPDFLLKDDPKYPGKSPFSTYRGYTYQGGFSDHLPLLLDLGFR